MHTDLAQQAISYALKGDWEKAVETNKLILKNDKKDTDALNRLARAHAELGNISKAKTLAKRVLKIDPFNSIASKSIDKWQKLKKGGSIKSGPSSAQAFLEEPGRTKIVKLLYPCKEDILAGLDSGDEVRLNTHGHRVSVTTDNNTYIGRLPDDLSKHIKKLISYGNEYKIFIKSISSKDVKVFIRETKRSEQLKDIPSFTSEKVEYVSFTPPDLVHKDKDVIKQTDDD